MLFYREGEKFLGEIGALFTRERPDSLSDSIGFRLLAKELIDLIFQRSHIATTVVSRPETE